MVTKKEKYDPFGDVLSVETAFVQASHALDLAGALAVESRDGEQLTKIAAMYIELGSRMILPSEDEEEEEEEHDLSSLQPIGFHSDVTTEPVKEAVETNGRTNRGKASTKAQSWRISRVHPEHG